MIKKITLISILMLSACSLENPPTPSGLYNQGSGAIVSLIEKGRQYPYFNIRLTGLDVLDQDSNWPTATAEDHRMARIFTAKAKLYMLKRLDTIRFAINTPEFETNLLKAKIYSARNASGPAGSIRHGEQLDMKRVLLILQRARHQFRIIKQQIPTDAAAVANVGTPLYTADLNTPIVNDNFLAFPNRDRLGEGGYVHDGADSAYHTGVMFHEILHTMGFTHSAGIVDLATEGGNLLERLIADPVWQKKYAKQLALFRPYYEELHREWVLENSYPVQTRGFSTDNRRMMYTHTNDHHEHDICVLNEDGTYTIIKGTKSI